MIKSISNKQPSFWHGLSVALLSAVSLLAVLPSLSLAQEAEPVAAVVQQEADPLAAVVQEEAEAPAAEAQNETAAGKPGVIKALADAVAPALTAPATEPQESQPARMFWDDRVDKYVADDLAGVKGLENADDLFVELSALLRIRAYQFDLILNEAETREEPANSYVGDLRTTFPDADSASLQLPVTVISVQQAHENFLGLYQQRIRLLSMVSDDLHYRVMATELYGMGELSFEFQVIWLELRYQALRIPAAGQQIIRMTTRAPLPLIWFLLYLGLLFFVFNWWRGWFPETIRRMRTHLLAVRPRTTAIVSRMRGLWYLERVRKPVEWYVFFQVLLSLIGFLKLEFVSEVSAIVIRWILFAWFAVLLLDAVVARGAGGTASESGKTRLQSFRLLAIWLLLLGLGLDLSARLAGEGALYALVWRAFQVLAFPVVFIQLAMWREELFRRARREDKDFMNRQEFKGQRGLGKFKGAAKLAGFLFANWLRRLLLRRLGNLDPALIGDIPADEDIELAHVDADVRSDFLNNDIGYDRYARSARRELVNHINAGTGGRTVVIGERGIGKDGFLEQVCADVDCAHIRLSCDSGRAADVERELAQKLGIAGPLDRDNLAEALEKNNIGVIAILNMHLLVRPKVGGFDELSKFSDMFDMMPSSVGRLMGMDRYAWQYIRCGLAESAAAVDVVELIPWTDEQITELLIARCEAADLKPDYSKVRVPSQYLDANEERRSERNRKGLLVMAASLSGGNPSIASRLFIDCIRVDEKGRLVATLPANSDSRAVEQFSIHQMLVLRVIAQSEHISQADIVANLRYPNAVVENTLQVAREKKWVAEKDGRFSLTWAWFRTITRVLSRQNLLAGVKSS